MEKLNFPRFNFHLKNKENKNYIFDEIRKKWCLLNPEEWVRQHCIHYLIYVKRYPKSLINVEKNFLVNKLTKRYDIIVFLNNGDVFLIVECKASNINISQNTFDQIARYNMALNSRYLMLSNGLLHYFCQINYKSNNYIFLKDLPEFKKNN
tara:strand:- start:2166 stop:2618 length:453 start_codon:yes stop_codon:yes gene_type:complete